MTPRELMQDSMNLLAENQRRLREAMKARGEGGEEFNRQDSEQAQRLARSAAALGAEMRKHGDELEDAAKNTTPDQRAEAAERWLSKLPRDRLRPIVERLVAVVTGKAKP